MSVQAPLQPQRTPRPSAPAAPAFTPARSLLLQRKCACGGTAGASGECEECKKKKMLQRRAANTHSVSGVPSVVHDVLSTPGRPLDAGTREFMEPRFGHDFSQVRVHDDTRAAESARAVDAHAYTVGQDIAFDRGRYDPHSHAGRQLLAHELAHTVQQRGLQRRSAGLDLPSGAEDRRLESEAETLAASAISGHRIAAAPQIVSTPVLSRAKTGVPKDVPGLKRLPVPTDADALDHDAYEVEEAFPLPAEKGPVKKKWNDIATGSGLRSSLDLRKDQVDVKQDRPELRAAWLGKAGWPAAEQDTLWGDEAEKVLGKKPVKEKFPRVNDVACHMDHIVELQVFGGNEKENLQVLDPSPNMSSGSQIRGYLSTLSKRIKDTLGADSPDGVILVWRTVAQASEICGPCCQIEKAVTKGGAAKGPTTSEGLNVDRHAVSFLGKPSEVLVPKNEKEATILLAESAAIVENRSVSRLIPGLSLVNYNHKKPAISAVFDPGARLPFELTKKAGKPDHIKVAVGGDGTLTVQSGDTKQPIHYSKLSEGMIEHVRNEGGQLAGSGTITPSLPLLKPMGKLGFDFTPTSLKITKSLDPKKAKLPIPGVTITEPQLGLELFPKFAATGGLKFAAMAGKTPLLDGSLTFVGDDSGFRAMGRINAHVPGVDKAEGDITYSQGKWTGGINVEAAQLKAKFKYVTAGSFTIGFSDAGIVAEGKVSLDLPHTENVEMGLKLGSRGWRLHGKGTVKAPRLTPIGLEMSYDGTTLEGTVSPGPTFKLFGFKGGIEKLHYKNGKVSGTGSLKFKTGKAEGTLTLNLLENGKFTGRGDVSYQVSENLLASGGAELDKDEKLHISGSLKYLKPIELPRTSFGGDKTLFKAGISIPIPGLSLGPAVGLKARIEGELTAGFKIGPAQIRNVEIALTGFNPLEENPNFEVAGGAEFFMPASAYIGGSISAGVMLDLFIADVTGGLTVRVRADLNGHVKATLKAIYSPKRYSMGADFELMLALILIFGIDAFLRARAGWGPFSVSTSKTWVLGEKKIDSGLKFGLRFPLKYASDEPFKAPSWDSIEFIKPTLDFGQLLDRVISSATPKEKEG